MNLLDVGYFKTEENVNTDLEIIWVAALQLPSFRVHFVLPLYQLLISSRLFKSIPSFTCCPIALFFLLHWFEWLIFNTSYVLFSMCLWIPWMNYFFYNCKLLRKNSFIDFNLIFSIWCDILKNYRCNCNVTLTAYPIYFHFCIFSSIQCQDSIVCV